jgi:hypothetical protein
MLTILRTLAALAVFTIGALLGSTGIGFLSVERSRLNQLIPGEIAGRPLFLGFCLIVMGFLLLFAPLEIGGTVVTPTAVILGTLAIVGLAMGMGHIRFERDLRITFLKWPKQDKGMLSRLVGWFLFLPSMILLIFALGLFGLSLTPKVLEVVFKAVSTALTTGLLKVVIGNLGEVGKKLEPWVVPAAIVILIAELLPGLPGMIDPATTPTATSPPPPATTSDLSLVRIQSTREVVPVDGEAQITVYATGDGLTYLWRTSYGAVDASDWCPRSTVTYTAPGFTAVDTVTVQVRDASGDIVEGEISIQIVQP